MYELKVVTRFAAAHQLKMVGEKCENLHGHNWKIEVVVTGETLKQGGVLVDFGEIKKSLAVIIGRLDHRFLNDTDTFTENSPPSSENIARVIAEALEPEMRHAGVRVSRVTAWESEDACATYVPD
jgi:6-pyruvoyltetrahydropterin/6-carboxytetrahydropterin synthase